MTDIMGMALLDYFKGHYSEDIITETNISEEDELPLPYLFRDFDQMPSIEQKAMRLSKGKTLDVGCGAGSHSLHLQEKGLDITAIDTSPGAIEVARLRGVKNAQHGNLLDLKTGNYDTVLLLMNGTGIFQNLRNIGTYLQHLKTLLNKNGQVLVDSSDLRYMYESIDGGGILVPGNRYYGELEFTMSYKGYQSEPFEWLYLDETLFEALCKEYGFDFEVMARGENFDYLARLTLLENR